MSAKIQLRNDIASQWTAIDPILAQGEAGIESDTGRMKIGDGSSLWSVLAYSSSLGDADDHNLLTNLQGGLPDEYYHLTAAEYADLGSSDHNALTNLQGGLPDEYYHLTAAQSADFIGASDLNQAIGNINNPLLDLPLNNSLAMKQGVGQVDFTRASTATYVDRYGVVQTAGIDEPRFEKEGLLIEGASTNLLKESGDMFDGSWDANIGGFYTATKDPSVGAPDGLSQANVVKAVSTAASALFNRQSKTYVPDVTYTGSLWFYIHTGQTVGTVGFFIDSDHSGGTNVTGYTDVVGEWIRVESTAVYSSTGSDIIDLNVTLNDGTPPSGFIFYYTFCQLEELPFASSYIPTQAVAVTRAAELCSVTYANNAPYAHDPITISIDAVIPGYTGATSRIYHFDGLTNAIIQMFDEDTVTTYYGSTGNRGIQYVLNQKIRIGTVYENGNLSAYSDGTQEGLTQAISPPIIGTTSVIGLGGNGAGSYPWYGHIANFRIWDKALTAEEVNLA